MRVVSRRSGRLLVVSRAGLAGILFGILAAGGCTGAAGTGTDGGYTPDAGSQDAGTCPDAGPTCGAAPVSDCGPCADGTACGGGTSVCWQGACAPGCVIQGTYYPAGVANPNADCEVCDPTTNGDAWSPAADGTACTNDGNDCTTDTCAGGQCGHTPVAQGSPCGTSGQCDASGQCSQGCTIGGQFIPDGSPDPVNPCQRCIAARSTTSWSYGPDGTACADDGDPCTRDLCDAGACVHPGAPTGTACGAGTVCNAVDQCVAGCFVGGTLYVPGAANPANACQTCTPATSTTGWSPVTNGTSCDDGDLCNGVSTCQGGSCQQTTPPVTCTAPGPCYGAATCDPAIGTCAFVAAPAGQSCGGGKLCNGAGACLTGCFIGGQFFADGATAPGDTCEVCTAAVSTSAWQPITLGTPCGPLAWCDGAGTCRPAGCYANGAFYATNQQSAWNPCVICNGADAWINAPLGQYACASDGNACTSDVCDGSGGCAHFPVPAGSACGSNACTGPGWCDSRGNCDRCDGGGTSCCVTGTGGPACTAANGTTVTCQ